MQIESGELEGLFGKDVKAALKQAIERHNESMREYSPDGYPDPVGRG
jgi:predicted P-loop ATPase